MSGLTRQETPEGPIYTTPSGRHPAVDLIDGLVHCDCPDWDMRKYPQSRELGITPTIADVRWHCIHIKAAVRDCLLRREIVMPGLRKLARKE